MHTRHLRAAHSRSFQPGPVNQRPGGEIRGGTSGRVSEDAASGFLLQRLARPTPLHVLPGTSLGLWICPQLKGGRHDGAKVFVRLEGGGPVSKASFRTSLFASASDVQLARLAAFRDVLHRDQAFLGFPAIGASVHEDGSSDSAGNSSCEFEPAPPRTGQKLPQRVEGVARPHPHAQCGPATRPSSPSVIIAAFRFRPVGKGLRNVAVQERKFVDEHEAVEPAVVEEQV
mmetsp:Transcript_15765/g.40132  ORF Transcript_15765/g.40132 Transcript_15765/m.40132 type:complete len:229 (+) Transcript_15765:263-949(+)